VAKHKPASKAKSQPKSKAKPEPEPKTIMEVKLALGQRNRDLDRDPSGRLVPGEPLVSYRRSGDIGHPDNPDFEPADTADQRLIRSLGFHPSFWLPWELAKEWKTTIYPKEPSAESVAAWAALWAATMKLSAPWGTRSMVEEKELHDGRPMLDNDLDLIRRYDPALVPDRRAVHSPDFASVSWYGKAYTFTPAQRAVVRVLWEAWEGGTPEIGAAHLFESANVELDRPRMGNIFRGHLAYGAMITKGEQRDTFRLREPGP
jgi:hypothetical protein